MNKQFLLIHKNKILYDILYELKSILGFKIKFLPNNNFSNEDFDPDTLIVSSENLNNNNLIKLENLPIELNKLLDFLNINLLKQKIKFQKDVKIGSYLINFNSRKMFKDEKYLQLTEKEAKIINFIKKTKNPTSVQQLQKNVWGHKSQLDTHTVETHVYRLRKKIKKIFNDSDFIKSLNKGYKIS
tara:strand:+ start:31 stop:585 length:555 start_codon:yes stop_codon:yes gene_type:complete